MWKLALKQDMECGLESAGSFEHGDEAWGSVKAENVLEIWATINILQKGCATMAYLREMSDILYRGADKSLARSQRKQATAKEDIYFHISYL